MIQVEKLSYGFPVKDLYKDISFALKAGQHCALIGSNGTGKSTLADMIIHSDDYLYDGKIIKDENCRIGYSGQFSIMDKDRDCTVFEYLSERFSEKRKAIAAVCEEMATADNIDVVFEKYQALLDEYEAMDGDNYESNIRKQLHVAGMGNLEELKLSRISGGEYKTLQIMREMLFSPNILILDEPDAFLDFGNLNSLCKLINGYKGTLLVITHNRYLLNHCFNKILHLENGDIQEYDGCYTEYRCSILKEKLKLKMRNISEQEEIERTQEMVDILRKRATIMVNPVIGKSVNAKQTHLNRLRMRHIKEPFIEMREPEIVLPAVGSETEDNVDADNQKEIKKVVLSITDYEAAFDKSLLKNVSFELRQGEKVAIVGANGTGKTTLVRDILKNNHPAIHIDKETSYAGLSQIDGKILNETKTVYEVMRDATLYSYGNYASSGVCFAALSESRAPKSGFDSRESIGNYLVKYCLKRDVLDRRICELSGGEQNLLQIALIANSNAQLLILDEPTSHLDIYAQLALEKAISEYRGTVLMVTHDFYLTANCADYVLLAEDNTVRRMRARNFRKMVYDKYFDGRYIEIDKKRREMETNITSALKKNDFTAAEKMCEQLKELSEK